MTTEKLEYDASLGGTVELPSHVPTYRYAAAALSEIKALINGVQQPTSTKLVFQKLPKQMRRRAMSHHPKRLPRKYRTAHKSQMAKAGKPKQSKRPSRKYRRRPKNLMQEYLRRQRKHVWLETHLWHAKRFHMIDRWGYRLPYASCDKTYRACYRASVQHCLLQDISYYACIELTGDLQRLSAGFARLSSSECGLSIAAKTYVSGRREGNIELFRDGQYPLGALGRARFMWRPQEDTEAVQRTLWLWLHPSAYQTVLEELINVFELTTTSITKVPIDEDMALDESSELKTKETSVVEPKKLCAKKERRLKFMTRTVANERVKSYTNTDNSIKLNSLKDKLNRFRLTGPLSQSVLAAALKPYALRATSDNWLKTLFKNESSNEETHATQSSYWLKASQLDSPSELLSNMIIGLNVIDPRLQRPQKRSKALPSVGSNAAGHELLMNTPHELPRSALWQSTMRDGLCQQMLSTQVYCDLRAKHAIVPGTPCSFEQDMQPVPIILIQRPGAQQANYKRLGYGCGWDIIAPPGYGMILWMTLIMWGAKPGGLREYETIARESGNEQHLPDTVSGRQQSALAAMELQAKYFRLPPNRRCNYRKFAIVSPFRAPFAQLVRDWLPEANANETMPASSYFILRNQTLLQRIDKSLRQTNVPLPGEHELPTNCLIQIQLRLKSRGSLQANALICLPTAADFKRQVQQIKSLNYAPIYTEPLLMDVNENQRRQLRRTHKCLLKRLRGRRVREKRKKQETATRRVLIRPANTAQLVASHFNEMCKLWLPTDATETRLSVRKQATREVFGYVTNANFSYTEATMCAVGYVTATGLRTLLQLNRNAAKTYRKTPMCLIRDTNSRNYRFATMKVNLSVTAPAY